MDSSEIDEGDEFKRLYFTPKLGSALGGTKPFTKGLHSQTIAKNALKWLRGQNAYTLHKSSKQKFVRRPTMVSGRGQQLQADLIDVHRYKRDNDGITFILTAIDVFSKKAWAIGVKNKSGDEISRALEKIFQDYPVRTLQTDKGTEFLNAKVRTVLKSFGVHHFTSEDDEIKASIVERWNRTLQERLHRWFTYSKSYRFVEALNDVVEGYNKRYHTSIGMAPNDVDSKNQEDVWWRLYGESESRSQRVAKFSSGDSVRVSAKRFTFSKGYLPRWTTEIFKIRDIIASKPIVYRLEDLAGEEIRGTFYEQELQKIEETGVYEIERVVGKKTVRGKKLLFVKWLGYPDKFNQWIKEKDLL